MGPGEAGGPDCLSGAGPVERQWHSGRVEYRHVRIAQLSQARHEGIQLVLGISDFAALQRPLRSLEILGQYLQTVALNQHAREPSCWKPQHGVAVLLS
ncbi:hypothetical protein Raf01_71710 [Rugosimonospora africana]|uniref:Uncharacterized protein n=1 Tax=Rugosimonospora africana TaxID=556532 RepID=A0A8J3VUK4_9ACTN|nr:hypothetical protein Raf01_71710 [Rugosimonospora africana]